MPSPYLAVDPVRRQYCYTCGDDFEQECPPEGSSLRESAIVNNVTIVYACMPDGTIYAASLYWSAMTITSIGYGDIAATPGNASELMLCALLMLAAGFAWADVVAGFVDVVSNLNPERNEFRQTMDNLNHFMCAPASCPPHNGLPLPRPWCSADNVAQPMVLVHALHAQL